ncbi:hypothetical protein A3B21_05380 [Candidatus Uhrbacteria bacterium RIFCSPLOWO2_01_FULL_47_24]|uniref:Uncharacterized protein n=1 Tax=Candidatus Uhrbacteria bacterium RIFCSPLOWO2_01_FULL_47_24 TaxID=1802401 RepID=A0A1F7UUZ4_9BACT|nr:MAG: hypothetical protein A2753_01300 [Candidatus Uhrbacteria bacterium RIFCSPHIGHO2_01_FULL_47_11]OGL67514.1 MAG: hypothetical protein A3D58_01675 [Candidatus Uhrbacteria bacterium RIFCSPHIGHO2_02_FULL_46_47]OGL82111.1 MAG: hypothetical protein A3B21_05380 [Candidatus Uhrbacteria bacterium RIFCSPLOWO2_01_FULL_47_24]OGL83875.1 MAG: hypothetical protein A3J03_01960 [Candidatus Uhrbacteria bacterium RIFCSPLOWO2_02_FULL_46_25]OGL91880.1 MAG: hypothetical protein A3H11_01810 [Candidatus Uhrbacte
MNRFVQFLVGFCSFIWILIGGAVIVGVILGATYVAREKPFENIAPLLQMVSGGSSAQNLEQQMQTPEFQACAKRILGEKRFNELMKGGQEPTSQEFAKVAPCFK